MAPIAHLVAEATTQVVWPTFLNSPGALVFMIPIAAILVGGVTGVAKLVIRHRERMAMIERGMDPDRPVGPGK